MSHTHTIEELKAREILDSRGDPTVEVSVRLKSGIQTKASVPSGASTGKHEAVELRDGEEGRYGGLGVRQACVNVNEQIIKVVKGIDVTAQAQIDNEMTELDGSSNLKNLGANAVLAVSLACARAAALSQGVPLYEYLHKLYQGASQGKSKTLKMPTPLFNIFNGGRHADTNLDFQEFMVIPGGVTESFSEQVRAGAEIFHRLKDVLKEHGLDTDVGSEGGYAPNIDSTVQALDMIVSAIKRAGYTPGRQIQLGTDVGASQLYDQKRGVYHFGLMDHDMTADQLISLFADWARDYPFIYIEDGVHEDDWANWTLMTEEFKELGKEKIKRERGHEFMIVGDDLFVTQVNRLQVGVGQGAGNAVIVKPNQVGTLSKTLEFVHLAEQNGYHTIMSHRSGETIDDFIADMSVAIGAEYIKAGSLARGERSAKYNRLMEIERELTGN